MREHRARYELAASLVGGKVVVDCASGDGTGTAIYARAGARHIHAFDLCEEAVEAVAARDLGNVTAIVADGRELPLEDASCDVAVSLETIEHMDRQDAFVAELARILRPGGTLVLSTPNRVHYSPGCETPWNPFHLRELEPHELAGLLAPHFGQIEWFGQAPARGTWLLAPFGRVAVRARQAWKLRLLVLDRDRRYDVRPMDYPSESMVVIATRGEQRL